jgi:hypothetical protein
MVVVVVLLLVKVFPELTSTLLLLFGANKQTNKPGEGGRSKRTDNDGFCVGGGAEKLSMVDGVAGMLLRHSLPL